MSLLNQHAYTAILIGLGLMAAGQARRWPRGVPQRTEPRSAATKIVLAVLIAVMIFSFLVVGLTSNDPAYARSWIGPISAVACANSLLLMRAIVFLERRNRRTPPPSDQ